MLRGFAQSSCRTTASSGRRGATERQKQATPYLSQLSLVAFQLCQTLAKRTELFSSVRGLKIPFDGVLGPAFRHLQFNGTIVSSSKLQVQCLTHTVLPTQCYSGNVIHPSTVRPFQIGPGLQPSRQLLPAPSLHPSSLMSLAGDPYSLRCPDWSCRRYAQHACRAR